MFPAATAVTVARNVARRGQHLSVQLIHYNLCIQVPISHKIFNCFIPPTMYISVDLAQYELFYDNANEASSVVTEVFPRVHITSNWRASIEIRKLSV